MTLLKSDVPVPVLPQERQHLVPGLGGEVIVRPLMLRERLALASESRGNGHDGPDFSHIAAMLAHAVVDANHEPLFTREQWEAWGAQHMTDALALWDVVWAMAGLDADASKKKSDTGNQNRDETGDETRAHADGAMPDHELG